MSPDFVVGSLIRDSIQSSERPKLQSIERGSEGEIFG